MNTEQQLIDEIKKWTEKIAEERKAVSAKDEKGKDFLKNIDAYISDSKHFFDKNDLVRSFEAIIWAWSWLEIGRNEGIIN
ncbi:DUF357 domain-containing protein [Candidatus Aenigmatarchaeota archaeon]